MEDRVSKLETDIEEIKVDMSRVIALREHCPLDGYKVEMKERCERLTDRIDDNKESFLSYKHTLDKAIADVETRCIDKTKQNRTIIGRVISSAIVLSICLIGVIGGIQLSKVSTTEFTNHLRAYRDDKQDEQRNFNKFLDTYTFDRDKRDNKIEKLFDEQRTFNSRIMKQNSLLAQQLEVVKVKLNVK